MSANMLQGSGGLARRWGLLWSCVLLLLLANPALARNEAQSVTQSSEQGLLWQVVAPVSGKISYLFGTIHSDDERVTTLPPAVQAAFNSSQRFVMEMIPDAESMLAVSQSMMLKPGASLRAMAGQKLFEQTLAALRAQGMPAEVADHMKPWAVMMLLSMPKTHSGQVLDLLLYSTAVQAGKATAGLESAEEQLAIFDKLSQAEQLALLEDAVTNYAQMANILEQMHVAYLARDLSALAGISDKYSKTGNARLTQKVNASLVERRNLRMAQRVDAYLRQGGAFVAVGALHLPGEQGLLQLLRKGGYRVTSSY